MLSKKGLGSFHLGGSSASRRLGLCTTWITSTEPPLFVCLLAFARVCMCCFVAQACAVHCASCPLGPHSPISHHLPSLLPLFAVGTCEQFEDPRIAVQERRRMEALSHEAQLPRYKRDLRRKLLKLRHLFVYLRQKVGNDVCVCVLKEIDHGWREERERERGGGSFN